MAGSAPSERLFSEAGDVLTKDRSRLDADLVEDLVFFGENLDHGRCVCGRIASCAKQELKFLELCRYVCGSGRSASLPHGAG